MKFTKMFLIIYLFMLSSLLAQWNPSYTQLDGVARKFTNDGTYMGIPSGNVSAELYYIVNSSSDTNWVQKYNSLGSYTEGVLNLNSYMGIESGKTYAKNIYVVNMPQGISTSVENYWTAPQHYSSIIVDILTANKIDSTRSIKLYGTDGSLYALFSKDTSYIPNLTVGNLSSTTIINGSSVRTNSLYSDTIIGNSPIFLMADSIMLQKNLFLPEQIKFTSSSYADNTVSTYTGGLVLKPSAGMPLIFNVANNYIKPNSDYQNSLGSWDKRFDTVNANISKVNRVKTDFLDFTNGYGISQISNYLSIGHPNYLTINLASGEMTNGGNIVPLLTSSYSIGNKSRIWREAFIDTIKIGQGIALQNFNNNMNLKFGFGYSGIYIGSPIYGNLYSPYDDWSDLGTNNNKWKIMFSNIIKLGTKTEPTGQAGMIYFNGTNFFGYNGSAWKQLDN